MPHVTLKSIANNPDIKEGMTREEIDAAIARHAETETLYDQPYEDKKTRPRDAARSRSRASRRTASLSTPTRTAAPTRRSKKRCGQQDFATMILENLERRACRTPARPSG